ncbi:Chemokine-like receptor 1 [Oryzias melastigma]|uniref:Chemokine-like receptor 1 n=1 Tax=Oryzias melastigma TaxID=30732 RepID=A0A834CH50_ORYME|nr:Chemokine-like receptor 1 [Oryzias melastigma]
MDVSYEYNEDYIYNGTEFEIATEERIIQHPPTCLKEASCVCVVVISVVIFLLGFSGNALVIWISGFKMKKTVNTIWYLSLAISDFVFCTFLPFNIASTVMEEWIFGRFMCKFVPFVMFLNMFSSIFLLVVISVDRCVSVMCPVWAQNQRTVKKASFTVVTAWLLASAMSVPSTIFRNVSHSLNKTTCINNYPSGDNSHKSVALSRALVGFVIPFVIIILCYSIIIIKLQSSRMAKSKKPFKVMTALIATFFICWLPYHVFILLEMNHQLYDHTILTSGLKIGTSLAAANSFLNPVLYVFMGKDFKKSLRSTLVSRLKNAIAEDGPTVSRYLSRSSSVDARASTHI